ncbi:MAG: hypothetical protein O2971_09375 [Proteobacteria bacterium]|nr:hypothetical protein [Pseudomonadota bacterium]
MIKLLRFTLLLASLSGLSLPAAAQEDLSQHWNGGWSADGTLFQIAVSVEGDVMRVQQVESLGFVWTSEDAKVDGNIVQVKVEYAGVTGIIQAELVDPDTAIVFAATCVPEFMVVCALAKGRQALFKRVPAN